MKRKTIKVKLGTFARPKSTVLFCRTSYKCLSGRHRWNRNGHLFGEVYIYIFYILSFFLFSSDRSVISPEVKLVVKIAIKVSGIRKSRTIMIVFEMFRRRNYLCEVFILAQFRFRVRTFCAIAPHFWRYNFSPLFLTLCAWHF